MTPTKTDKPARACGIARGNRHSLTRQQLTEQQLSAGGEHQQVRIVLGLGGRRAMILPVVLRSGALPRLVLLLLPLLRDEHILGVFRLEAALRLRFRVLRFLRVARVLASHRGVERDHRVLHVVARFERNSGSAHRRLLHGRNIAPADAIMHR